MLISPIWIAPVFNKFGPMKDPVLETSILDLAQRAGISGARVFEVEKSVDTKTMNAYVAGLGRTKRIVLWDTLLAKLERRETLFVMGHEMGHYVLGHVLRSVALISALFILGFGPCSSQPRSCSPTVAARSTRRTASLSSSLATTTRAPLQW
jgi:Zn-dependent protease with chaperone function